MLFGYEITSMVLIIRCEYLCLEILGNIVEPQVHNSVFLTVFVPGGMT